MEPSCSGFSLEVCRGLEWNDLCGDVFPARQNISLSVIQASLTADADDSCIENDQKNSFLDI